MNSRYLMLLVFTISTAACDPTVEGGGDTGGGGKAPPDLFACNLEVDCFLDYGHLGETITEEAVRCGGQLIASGEAGVEKTSSTPGPWPTTTESLYVVHGNGTLTMQTRSKCATDDGCARPETHRSGDSRRSSSATFTSSRRRSRAAAIHRAYASGIRVAPIA
jgi:hypothetical protein